MTIACEEEAPAHCQQVNLRNAITDRRNRNQKGTDKTVPAQGMSQEQKDLSQTGGIGGSNFANAWSMLMLDHVYIRPVSRVQSNV